MNLPKRNKTALFFCWLTGFLILPLFAIALPDDRNQPIEIQADSAERDAKTGVTTYTGNVDIKQGSIHIAASTVTLKTDKNDELSTVIATGGPARYEQQISGPDDKVEALGSTIHYQIQQDLITLQQNASLEQKGTTIKGERIEYDVKAEKVKASGAQKGSTDNSKRITVVIPPSKKKTDTSSDKKTQGAD